MEGELCEETGVDIVGALDIISEVCYDKDELNIEKITARESTLLFLCRSAETMQRRTSVRRSWWTDGQLPYRPRGEQPDRKQRLFSQRDEQQGGK